MRYALIENGIVVNVIEQDTAPEIEGQWVACGSAGPGWTYDGTAFHTEVAPKSWSGMEFYRRLTQAERIAIRSLAVTDQVAADFIHTLDHAIASGAQIVSTDTDLVAGLAYLSANPQPGPCLAMGRSNALMT